MSKGLFRSPPVAGSTEKKSGSTSNACASNRAGGRQSEDLGKTYKISEDKCNLCKLNVRENDQALQCDACNSWIHSTCMNMSKSEFNMWSKSDHPWFCKECRAEVKENSKGMGKMMQLMNEMMSKLCQNEEDNKSIRCYNESLSERLESIEQTIRNTKENIKDNVVKEIKDEMKREIVGEIKEEILNERREQEEKQKRQNNSIIYNADESESDDGNVREMHDKQLCTNLVLNVMGIEEAKMVKIMRLGRKVSPEGRDDMNRKKGRPMMVVLDSVWTKSNILRNAKKIRFASDEAFRRMVVAPDLTKEERVKDKALRDELRERRATGETDIFISRGMIRKQGFLREMK